MLCRCGEMRHKKATIIIYPKVGGAIVGGEVAHNFTHFFAHVVAESRNVASTSGGIAGTWYDKYGRFCATRCP